MDRMDFTVMWTTATIRTMDIMVRCRRVDRNRLLIFNPMKPAMGKAMLAQPLIRPPQNIVADFPEAVIPAAVGTLAVEAVTLVAINTYLVP
jgi:hypothetical protein